MIGYVTIVTLPFFGLKAVPIGKPENGTREFILLEKHPLAPTGKSVQYFFLFSVISPYNGSAII